MINLWKLNMFISYEHFKKEGFHCLTFLLEENDHPCKIGLKEVTLQILLSNSHQNIWVSIGQSNFTISGFGFDSVLKEIDLCWYFQTNKRSKI